MKYTNGDGTPVNIYSGLAISSVDYPWGLAVASNGDVCIAASNVDNKVTKLSYDNALDTYTPSDLLSGNYYDCCCFLCGNYHIKRKVFYFPGIGSRRQPVLFGIRWQYNFCTE